MSQILTFHIELVHISPPIRRQVEVPEKLTLRGLRREDGTEWILCGIPDEIREHIA